MDVSRHGSEGSRVERAADGEKYPHGQVRHRVENDAVQISVFSSSLSRVYNAPPPVEQELACSPSECVDP
jgi:hypothetical protein